MAVITMEVSVEIMVTGTRIVLTMVSETQALEKDLQIRAGITDHLEALEAICGFSTGGRGGGGFNWRITGSSMEAGAASRSRGKDNSTVFSNIKDIV